MPDRRFDKSTDTLPIKSWLCIGLRSQSNTAKKSCELVCIMLKTKARSVHGSHRGDSVSLMTSVRAKQSSYTKDTNASVLFPKVPPVSMFGRLSHPITSTNILPRCPEPTSIQLYDPFNASSSILSFVSHIVSSLCFGSGAGRTRYYECHETEKKHSVSQAQRHKKR